jgi:hypothetical protein
MAPMESSMTFEVTPIATVRSPGILAMISGARWSGDRLADLLNETALTVK